MADLFSFQESPSHGRRPSMSDAVAYFAPPPAYTADIITTSRQRVAMLAGVFVLCFTVICLRLISVMLFTSDAEIASVNYHHGSKGVPSTSRAEITDRNGVLLATNLVTNSVYADPQEMQDIPAAAKALGKIFDIPADVLEARLSPEHRFVWIERDITPKQANAVNALGIPGVHFEKSEKRTYPKGALTSHVVGYVNTDNRGMGALERGLDERLSDLTQIDEPVRLSIDVRLQHIVRDELMAGVRRFSAKAGIGIVLDVKTGEVLSLVSLPDFDPHVPGDASADALFNRASLGVYEMGSTFKTFTVALALDRKSVSFADGFDASQPIRYAGHTIRDSHAKGRWLSVPEIYIYSSNIGTAKMAEHTGFGYQRTFLEKLGFMEPLAIEIPEKGRPISPAQWRNIRSMTVSYGHGISVTPLHLARGIATLINGGKLMPLTMVKDGNGKYPKGEQVIDPETSEKVRALMRLTVMKGTGRKADVVGYAVGGKTGTAEKSGQGGYNHKALMSSFVSAFPMNDPRYLVLTMLDEPHGIPETHNEAGGGWTAAPITGAMIQRMGPVLGVQPAEQYDNNPLIQQVLHSMERKTNSHAAF